MIAAPGYVARLTTFLALGVLLLGCEEQVAAPVGVEEPYSLYGIINPRLEQQTLLVSPIEDSLSPLDRNIDASVRSVDLTSGTEYAWNDSVVTNDTGQLAHVYWANFRPAFGSRHRIEIRRSDEAVSTVEADVPGRVVIEQEDSGTRYLDVAIQGDEIRLVTTELTYGVRSYNFKLAPGELGPYTTYTFSHSGQEIKEPFGWSLRFNLSTHYEQMRSFYHIDFEGHENFLGFRNPLCDGLALDDLTIQVTVGSNDWDPPGGDFNSNLLIQPGTLTNVRNGYGFVAGGYNEERQLYPSPKTLEDTWWFDAILDREPEVIGCVGHARSEVPEASVW